MNKLHNAMRREFEDLFLLVTCTATIFLVWLLFLGWNPSQYIQGHDSLKLAVPFLVENIKTNWNWHDYLYRLNLQGGIVTHDILGSWIFYELGAKLGLSVTSTMNIFIIILQALVSFMGVRTIMDLSRYWGIHSGPFKKNDFIPTTVPIIILVGFAAFLGWRLSYGHQIFILGSFPFLCAVSMLVTAKNGRVTVTLMVVSLICVYQCFTTGGQQALVYSVVFGAPILIGFAWPSEWKVEVRRTAFSIFLIFLLMIAGLLLAMPRLSGVLSYLFSGEAARALGGRSQVNSYILSTPADWLSSIPWALDAVRIDRDPFLRHEVNYAIGPMVLLFLLVPWRKAAPLVVGMGISLLLALMFSMNVPPVPSVLMKLFPILDSFRVPSRAVFPFMFVLPMIASAAVLYSCRDHDSSRFNRFVVLWSVLVAMVGYFLPGEVREIFIWVFALLVVGTRLVKRNIAVKPVAILLIFSMISLAAFKERLLPYSDVEKLIGVAGKIGADLVKEEPALKSPLSRVKLDFEIDEFGINSPWVMGLSAVDGYWFPTRRVSQFAAALNNSTYAPTNNLIVFDVNTPEYEVVRQLYNIVAEFRLTKDAGYEKIFPGKSAGESWFSESYSIEESMGSIARIMKGHGGGLHEALKKKVLVLREDLQKLDPVSAAGSACSKSRVLETKVQGAGQDLVVQVENTEGACPLTIAMNYAPFFRAKGLSGKGGSEIPLKTFPSFGTLMGVVVPAGAEKVVLEAKPFKPWWTDVAYVMGLAMFAGVIAAALWLKRKIPDKV